MSELLSAVGVAVLLFVTTNVDDIFVLVAFFADPACVAMASIRSVGFTDDV